MTKASGWEHMENEYAIYQEGDLFHIIPRVEWEDYERDYYVRQSVQKTLKIVKLTDSLFNSIFPYKHLSSVQQLLEDIWLAGVYAN